VIRLLKTMITDKSESQYHLLAPVALIPACQRSTAEADWFPPVDILEDAHEYLFKIDLPETKPENIRVVVERNGLVISGERPKLGTEQKQLLRVERPHGYFERRFALPDDASREEIDSVFQENVLELRVRKVRPILQNPVAATTTLTLETHSAS
jgi:HSP20 family protein